MCEMEFCFRRNSSCFSEINVGKLCAKIRENSLRDFFKHEIITLANKI